MKYTVTAFVLIIIASFCYAGSAHAADSLQIRPLIYKETLTSGQKKRGVVDVSNASDKTATIHMNVQLFRQIDNDGSLEFYDRPYVASAIIPDIQDFDLGPKEAVRIGFTVDSTKLPTGDIFAAIFATTQHSLMPQAIVPAARVGTLLVLENGTPGPRQATISNITVAPFQIDSKIKGTVSVYNPANPDTSTGFFPLINVQVSPWGESTKFDGPLVYAGRTRTFDFSVPSNQFGIYAVKVQANNATKTVYVFVMTGRWRILVPLITFAIILASLVIWWWLRRRRSHEVAS